jgi:hypothetical protein
MPKTLKIPKTLQRRSAALSGTFNREQRTVEAVLATSGWVDGPLGPERLVMTPAAVDLSRASPMPLHDDHGPQIIGSVGERIGVVEHVRVSNGKLKGRLRFSRNAAGDSALNDVEDKIITHVSIGYRVLDARPAKQGLLITRWAPHEVSTPSIVADRAATIQRTATMTDEHDTVDVDDDDTPIEDTPAYRAGELAGRQRVAEVTAAFAPFPGAVALRERALSEAWDMTRVRAELLSHLGNQSTPTGRGTDIQAGEQAIDKFMRAASQALEVRAGIIDEPAAEMRPIRKERLGFRLMTVGEAVKAGHENPFTDYSLRELAREYLKVAGDSVRGDPRAIVGRALTRAGIIGHSTSDFANLLVDASNKSLQIGYEEAPETWDEWTGTMSLPDFKTGHMTKLSTFSDLDVVPESGEITYGTFSDFKETIAILEYGKLFSITRKALINDDLNAFSEMPRGLGRAASRKIGDLVYAILTANGNMSDGNALFSAAHSNFVAGGSGAAPSVTTLNAAYASMATQTDPASNTINIVPSHIIAPHALRGTIDTLLASQDDPAEGGTTSFSAKNIWRARLRPTYDARLDSNDAAKWYLAAARNLIDTVKVAFLNGKRSPRLNREETITVSGVVLSVNHDIGVAAADWRGLYHNDGN